MNTLMQKVEPMARQLESLDERISRVKHELEELTSDRETLNQDLIAIMQEQGVETTLGLSGGGTVKLTTAIYPTIKDLDGLTLWSIKNNVTLPPYTINAKTMQGWYKEQMDNSKLLPPEEVISTFIKIKAKVLKK